MDKDEFGNRMKKYEKEFTSVKINPSQWMCVRIDGKGFSKFTKEFAKPFDGFLARTMIDTTKILIKETHASLGYTQSDEITLLYPPTEGERIFGGKVSKINSVFASIATANFNNLIRNIPRSVEKLAYFDCRTWEVPSDIEASNTLLWRVQDARKNSISSYFRWTVGHKEMHNLSGKQMVQYLIDKNYPDWNHLSNMWKYGTYIKPFIVETYLTQEELDKIPERKRPVDLKVKRTQIQTVDFGYYGDIPLEQRISFIK